MTLVLLACMNIAHAQPSASAELDAAYEALRAAEFTEADLALDRAARHDFDGPELQRWLELRALVSHADERLGALEEALSALASLSPAPDPPPSFPRALVDRYGELRALDRPVRVDARISVTEVEEARRVGLVAIVPSDPGHLVRSTRVHARIGTSEWRLVTPELRLDVPGDPELAVDLAYYVEAFGPGNAHVAFAGTRENPLLESIVGIEPSDTLLVALLVGAGVLVAGGLATLIVAAVLTDGFLDDTAIIHPPPGS